MQKKSWQEPDDLEKVKEENLEKILDMTIDDALQFALEKANTNKELPGVVYEELSSKLGATEQAAFTQGLVDKGIKVLGDQIPKKDLTVKKPGISEQYKKKIMDISKHPNVNKLSNTASFHLNKVIDKLADEEDEFLPRWKKREADKNLSIGDKLRKGIIHQGYHLKESDIGTSYDLTGGLGNVKKEDVGKEVWLRDYGVEIKGNEKKIDFGKIIAKMDGDSYFCDKCGIKKTAEESEDSKNTPKYWSINNKTGEAVCPKCRFSKEDVKEMSKTFKDLPEKIAQRHMVVCDTCGTIQKMPYSAEDPRCPNCKNVLVPKQKTPKNKEQETKKESSKKNAQKLNKWFVSRQRYWPDGDLVVEIASGGLDYANPDMLSKKYLGEGEEYSDPRKAVEAAFSIADAWKKDEPDKEIGIASGFTGGDTMPFSPQTDEELKVWAENTYEKMEKCDACGKPLGDTPYTLVQPYDLGEKFCSEYCADKAYNFYVEEDEKLNKEVPFEEESSVKKSAEDLKLEDKDIDSFIGEFDTLDKKKDKKKVEPPKQVMFKDVDTALKELSKEFSANLGKKQASYNTISDDELRSLKQGDEIFVKTNTLESGKFGEDAPLDIFRKGKILEVSATKEGLTRVSVELLEGPKKGKVLPHVRKSNLYKKAQEKPLDYYTIEVIDDANDKTIQKVRGDGLEDAKNKYNNFLKKYTNKDRYTVQIVDNVTNHLVLDNMGYEKQAQRIDEEKRMLEDTIRQRQNQLPNWKDLIKKVQKAFEFTELRDIWDQLKDKQIIASYQKTIKIGNKVFNLHLAETPEAKEKGLEVFASLNKNEGMLFPFSPPSHVQFHMGKVQFPIDIVFLIDGPLGLKVAKIIHSAQPGTDEIWSNSKTSYVVELTGGSCKESNIKVDSICVIEE